MDTYVDYVLEERKLVYQKGLSNFSNLSKVTLLEIGAGHDVNLKTFHEFGIPYDQMTACELQEKRVAGLRVAFPSVKIHLGDFLETELKIGFNLILISLVFTSVIDESARRKIAAKAWSVLNANGILVFYDFSFNNHSNQNVRKVTKDQLRSYFLEAKQTLFRKVTLAPPIVRKVGSLYPLINQLFPFLRTHYISFLKK